MKILIVNDFNGWAISQLSNVIVKHNKHLDIQQIYIPPKELRADPIGKMAEFEEAVKSFNPDVIHFQYWDIANTLSKSQVCKDRKLILTHHNQKNLLTHDWRHFDAIICHTQKAKKILESAGYWNVEVIQHGIDIERFKFNENYDPNNRMLGYVGRIVPWKGLVEILRAAKELNTEVVMMGRIDKADYWQKCLEYDDQMDIRFQTPTEDQPSVYHEMAVYVGNSCDNIEEGTLPLLEAMACGIPVVTTASGEAADIIQDGVNGIVVDFENYDSLKAGIERMMKADRDEMREKAWRTVRNMNEETMARRYEKLYYRTVYSHDLVSVIIPTFNRHDSILRVIEGYSSQSYSPLEIIIIDDNSTDNTEEVISDYALKNRSIPIKYINTGHDGYGLAKARNMGIFEATGHYIIFSDDRYVPDYRAVEAFVEKIKSIKEPCAIWGDKGAGKRDFIENFFIIRKKDIINAGMFNERIDEYGGQSQEIRERLRGLGYRLNFEPSAMSTAVFGTHNKSKKRYQILHMKTKLWRLRN